MSSDEAEALKCALRRAEVAVDKLVRTVAHEAVGRSVGRLSRVARRARPLAPLCVPPCVTPCEPSCELQDLRVSQVSQVLAFASDADALAAFRHETRRCFEPDASRRTRQATPEVREEIERTIARILSDRCAERQEERLARLRTAVETHYEPFSVFDGADHPVWSSCQATREACSLLLKWFMATSSWATFRALGNRMATGAAVWHRCMRSRAAGSVPAGSEPLVGPLEGALTNLGLTLKDIDVDVRHAVAVRLWPAYRADHLNSVLRSMIRRGEGPDNVARYLQWAAARRGDMLSSRLADSVADGLAARPAEATAKLLYDFGYRVPREFAGRRES